MKFMHLNLATLIFRFYLLMAVVIIAFFSGLPWLSILALPIFFSALMGISFQHTAKSKQARPADAPERNFSAEAHAH